MFGDVAELEKDRHEQLTAVTGPARILSRKRGGFGETAAVRFYL
jgi:hypothetical protein